MGNGPRWAGLVAAALTCALIVVAVPGGADPLGQVTEVAAGGITPGFTANGQPGGLVTGPDGNLWFVETAANRIGRITPSGTVTEFAGLAGGSEQLISAGPDGNVWYADSGGGGRIVKVTPGGAVTAVATGGVTPGFTVNSGPIDIVTGPDGNLWFTELGGNRIGRITLGGAVTEFSAGLSPSAGPDSITAGPDGNLWFTEDANPGRIGKITTGGTITEVATGGITPGFTANAGPVGIASGPDGNVWFTELQGNSVARITPGGTVSEFSSGLSPTAGVDIIAPACDGNLWFTEGVNPGRIGRITTSGSITEVGVGGTGGLSANSHPAGIGQGPDGNVWFTEFNNPGRVAKIGNGGCSASVAVPGGTATVTASAGFVTNLTNSPIPASPPPPPGVLFPFGLLGFKITGLSPGASTTVTITLPSPVSQYWKLQNGIWFNFPGATFSGNQVTFKLTDGGIGDADGVANGTIVEPGAPATTPVVVTPRFTG